MIILIFILSLVLLLISMAKDSPMQIIFGGFVLLILVCFPLSVGSYLNAHARINLYEEAVAIKTEEFKEGLRLQEGGFFKNKHNNANFATLNADTPIASTQEYIKQFHAERASEREAYLQAKRTVFSIENGMWWFVAWLYKPEANNQK